MADIQQLIGSQFVRSTMTLGGGSAVATVLPVLAAPVLGRIYNPEDYGVIGLYMAIATILSAISVLQFQNAIIAEESDERAGAAAWLCLISALGTSALTFCGVLFYLASSGAHSSAARWFWFLPATVLFAGLSATASFVANRERAYGFIAKSQALLTLVGLATSISLGFQGWGSTGLMVSYFVGQAAQGGLDIWILRRSAVLRVVGRPQLLELESIARRHWRFPAFTVPTSISGHFAQQVPLLAMSVSGNGAAVGSFSRARQLVSMPITLLGNSAAQVFRREAAEDYQRTGSCRPRARRLATALLLLGGVPCGVFMILAPQIMAFILGPDWREAGEMARVLAPMLLFRLISVPLASIFYFTDHQALALKMNLLGHVPLSLGMLTATSLGVSPLGLVFLFSGGYSCIYLVESILAYKIASQAA